MLKFLLLFVTISACKTNSAKPNMYAVTNPEPETIRDGFFLTASTDRNGQIEISARTTPDHSNELVQCTTDEDPKECLYKVATTQQDPSKFSPQMDIDSKIIIAAGTLKHVAGQSTFALKKCPPPANQPICKDQRRFSTYHCRWINSI